MSQAHSHPFGPEMAAKSLRNSTGKEGCDLKITRKLKIALVEAKQTENSNIPEPSDQEMRHPRSSAFSLHPWWQGRGKEQRLHGPKSGWEPDILERGIMRGRKETEGVREWERDE